MYVPISIDEIGRKLSVDGDIIFGRLYYHFNNKHSYLNPDGSKVSFFELELGDGENRKTHCIQFPLMASVLAELKADHRRFILGTALSVLSLIVSVVAVVISVLV